MFNIMNRFRFIILIFGIILTVLMFGDSLSLQTKQIAFTLSSNIRALLMFLIPLLVLPFIISSISMLRSKGVFLLFSLLFLISASNFTAISIGGILAASFVPMMDFQTVFNSGDAIALNALFEISLEPLFSIEITLILGFIIGVIMSVYRNEKLESIVEFLKAISTFFFKRIFIPILPIYIFGTLLQLDMENDFRQIFKDFGSILVMIACVQIIYIAFLFFVGSAFSLPKTFKKWVNSLPAGLLGFSTMSSLVTMPVTMKVTEENLKDKKIAQIAVTTTVNCHCLGEAIAITVFSMSILMMSNGMMFPDWGLFFKFAIMLTLVQYTAVAVPGGSVVVVIPVLISSFGFSPEMIGLVTTLSLFMDPVGTANNVMGNCGFALIIQRYFNAMNRFFKKEVDPVLEAEEVLETR